MADGLGGLSIAAPALLVVAVGFGVVLGAASWISAGPIVRQGRGHARDVWYPTAPGVTRRGVLYVTAGVAATATGVVVARVAASPPVPTNVIRPSPATAATSATPIPNPSPSPAEARGVSASSTPVVLATPTSEPTVKPTAPQIATPPPRRLAEADAAAPTPAVAARPIAAAPSPTVAATVVPSAVASPTATLRAVVALKLPVGATPLITSIDQLYKVSKNFFADPAVDGRQWRLGVAGLVGRATTLALSDLTGLHAIEKPHTLTCISNDVGGNLISNAVWKGVRLADLLHEVGVRDGVRKVVFYAADGYADSISLERAMDPGTLLAYQMDGATLPVGHGYPLRVLVPNIYGMKNVKWLTKIELVNNDFQGYWQRGGWSDPAPIQSMSRIDVARGRALGQPITVAGIAFAGERGIARVELSVDSGKTWQPAQVETPDAQNVWTRWVTQWTPTARGTITLVVRAIDGAGHVQSAIAPPPFPDCANGYHPVQVRIG